MMTGRNTKTKAAFRHWLNVTYAHAKSEGRNAGTGRKMAQRTRPYGDYLYAADRGMFDALYAEWLAKGTL